MSRLRSPKVLINRERNSISTNPCQNVSKMLKLEMLNMNIDHNCLQLINESGNSSTIFPY